MEALAAIEIGLEYAAEKRAEVLEALGSSVPGRRRVADIERDISSMRAAADALLALERTLAEERAFHQQVMLQRDSLADAAEKSE